MNQGLINPLPADPGKAQNWAGQILFPAKCPTGQVKVKPQKLNFRKINSKSAQLDSQAEVYVSINHNFLTFSF